MTRLAVVLFNLGGPDRPESVRPFLFQLFNDHAIISLPQPARALIAGFIAYRRAKIARAIYDRLGGSSPLLANTQAQAAVLEARLRRELGEFRDIRVFCCMRYWHPVSADVQREVEMFGPDRVILLPLYPQYSTTTTKSSIANWQSLARSAPGMRSPETRAARLKLLAGEAICCYPEEPGWIEALAARAEEGLRQLADPDKARLIFSAHGLPKRIIARGDPYAAQVEATCRAVIRRLGRRLDWVLAYQSQVGPLEWIGPSTISEIARAGREGRALVVVPVAFVSEHSETLVELDIEYRHLAEKAGVPAYIRVPAVGTHPAFIEALAKLVGERLAAGTPKGSVRPGGGLRHCPAGAAGCALSLPRAHGQRI